MARLDLLKNSCRRLPGLVEANAPTCMLVSEFRLLSQHALDVIADSIRQDTRAEFARRKAAKKAAKGGDDEAVT